MYVCQETFELFKKTTKKLKHIVLLPVNKFKTAINWKQLSLPEMQGDSYGNAGCEVFKRGNKIRNIFCLKINIIKGNCWTLSVGVMGRCPKYDIVLENEVVKKLIILKNFNSKKCVPKLIFFNEKTIEKGSDDFLVQNWLWKSNFGTIWHIPITPILKIQ